MKNKLLFLVHGFRSDSGSMGIIFRYFNKRYPTFNIELPLSYQSLDIVLNRLKKEVDEVIQQFPVAKLNFVGHSTGGIVIKMLMNIPSYAKQTETCIFLAVPNNGTKLADQYKTLLPLGEYIHKPISYLTPSAINSLNLKKPVNVFYGAIAGNEELDSTKLFFHEANDGIVELRSALSRGMTDSIILPYNHFQIHKNLFCCILIEQFFKNKQFSSKIKEDYNMKSDNKFEDIVENGYIDDLCSSIKGNISWGTLGGTVCWDNLAEYNGWRLQKNKFTQHVRILNPDNVRKAWGSYPKIIATINLIHSRITIQNESSFASNESNDSTSIDYPEKKEEILKTIEKLGELRDKGYVSNEEYDIKKSQLLSKL